MLALNDRLTLIRHTVDGCTLLSLRACSDDELGGAIACQAQS